MAKYEDITWDDLRNISKYMSDNNIEEVKADVAIGRLIAILANQGMLSKEEVAYIVGIIPLEEYKKWRGEAYL